MNALLSAERHRRLAWRLALTSACGLGFGLALVPFYDAFCVATGLNGRTAGDFGPGGLGLDRPLPTEIDLNRQLRVQFLATTMPGLPWRFEPMTPAVDLHPGELRQVRYRVHNLSAAPITGRAVPSVSPGQAARHFTKLACFCYQEQTLAPGEVRELPLNFVVRPDIDPALAEITLSYSFYPSAPPTP